MKVLDSKGLVRKINFDSLPRKENGRISWKNSIGKTLRFLYSNTSGELKIEDYYRDELTKVYMLRLLYLDQIFLLPVNNIYSCSIRELLNLDIHPYKLRTGQVLKNDKQNLTIVEQTHIFDGKQNIRKRKAYKYKCNDCGYVNITAENTLLNKRRVSGCPCCAQTNKKPVLGINTIWDTDPWMCELGLRKEDAQSYVRSSNKKVIVICPLCLREKQIDISAIYRDKSIKCICKDGKSYPSKVMFSILEQSKIEFETEKKFSWCTYIYKDKVRYGLYDFYFEKDNKKYIVEIDGSFHYKETKFNRLQEVAEKDKIKDFLAKEHGITIVRIDCRESDIDYIQKNVDKSLKDIIDLSKIDWVTAETFALSNLVKRVCDYKKENNDATTTNLMKIFKLSRTTIQNYLKKGTKIGWCSYSPREEELKRNKKFSEFAKNRQKGLKEARQQLN
jgi:very-short-patch-repair endonuclease